MAPGHRRCLSRHARMHHYFLSSLYSCWLQPARSRLISFLFSLLSSFFYALFLLLFFGIFCFLAAVSFGSGFLAEITRENPGRERERQLCEWDVWPILATSWRTRTRVVYMQYFISLSLSVSVSVYAGNCLVSCHVDIVAAVHVHVHVHVQCSCSRPLGGIGSSTTRLLPVVSRKWYQRHEVAAGSTREPAEIAGERERERMEGGLQGGRQLKSQG